MEKIYESTLELNGKIYGVKIFRDQNHYTIQTFNKEDKPCGFSASLYRDMFHPSSEGKSLTL